MEVICDSINNFIQDNLHIINEEIQKTDRYRYHSFGTDFESYIAPLIKNYLEAIFPDIQVTLARNKNEFPDVTVKYNGETMAFDSKCGSHHQKTDKGWRKINQCETDMGTLREIEKKIEKFNGKIVYIFAVYSCTDTIRCIYNIHVRPFYELIGTSQNGRIIKYRKKDGNMRPASFEKFNNPHFTSLDQFVNDLAETKKYRSIDIIDEHLKLLKNQNDNRSIFKIMKALTESAADEKIGDFINKIVDKLEQRENIIENGTGATAPAHDVCQQTGNERSSSQ
jgi:hypothetical protein